MRLRNEQLRALEGAAHDVFRARLTKHLCQTFPDICADLDAVALDAIADSAKEKAQALGLTSERDVAWLSHLVLIFGYDFDINPALPWSAAVAPNARRTAPPDIAELYRRAMSFVSARRRAI